MAGVNQVLRGTVTKNTSLLSFVCGVHSVSSSLRRVITQNVPKQLGAAAIDGKIRFFEIHDNGKRNIAESGSVTLRRPA